jgi:hypothetical protein
MWREGGWRKMKENNVRGKRIQENVCGEGGYRRIK